jgi:hypothetical protein
MKKYLKIGTLIVVLAASSAGLSFAATEISTTKDLTAVIALQGLPCGQVVSAVKQGDSDYLASCQDGNHYRVSINAEGRVVVEKK